MAKTKEEAANSKPLSGSTIHVQTEVARSLAAAGEGHWYKWTFSIHGGLVYATAKYAVFFNASGIAFTGNLGDSPKKNWRTGFMQLVTRANLNDIDPKPLFDILAEQNAINDLSLVNYAKQLEVEITNKRSSG